MFSKLTVAAFAAALMQFTMAVPVLERRSNIIDVKLSTVSETEVAAVVTNNGLETVNLLNYGTFTDDATVQKLSVYQNDAEVAFTGVLKNYLLSDIPAEAFTALAPGESVKTVVNLPAVHDISGGSYSVVSYGAIPYAAANSTTLSGAATFASNTLAMSIPAAAAAKVAPAIKARSLDKRTVLQNCAGTQATLMRSILSNSVTLATNAATAATSGSSTTFNTYFRSTSSSVRSTVAARFRAVASESGSSTSGSTTYSCTDDYGQCSSNVLAYTYPSLNHIANCPLYYSALPLLTTTCHAQDQVTTTIHEFTHAPGVYSPGTQDYAYGYSASTSLTSARAVLNADSYALYANAIYAGC